MITAIQLIQHIEAAGGRFAVSGGRLGIHPAEIVQPVMEELLRNKTEIIELLARRPSMPLGVRLIRWEPSEGSIQLSSCERVTRVDDFVRSTLRQVDARLRNKSWLAGNWTLSTLIERLAAVGCFVELENRMAALQ